jgi:PKD repeat protein
VKVYNDQGDDSGWASGGRFTTPSHYYPYPSFTVSPAATVTAGEPVIFRSNSQCYPSGTISSCDTQTWDFGDGTADTGDTVTHSYTAVRSYQVNLTVSDGTFTCNTTGATITVKNVSSGSLQWREISPF